MSAHVSTRRADRPILDRVLLVLLGAVVVSGVACAAVTAAAPSAARWPVAAFTGVAALVASCAVAAAVYGLQTARALHDHVAETDAELARLADETLPAVVKRLRDGASADTALAEAGRPSGSAQRRILRTLADELGRGERMRAAAMAACANAAGRVQALATSMLADLRDMENRHGEEVLGDLLKLDHSTAQAGRLADSIAVLTGARSGRRWTKPIVMESILRGAVGRISAYQRVRVHSTSTAAVAGYAAEGVMHALAELMDNATSFSPPSEEVHVYVEEVYAGIVVTIEDGGLAMSPAALDRAERAVSAESLDLTTLSGTRLGLAVVGCLARKHGLTVSFRPSSRGGTGVVVLIPRQLITEGTPATAPSAPRAAATAPAPAEEATVETAPASPEAVTPVIPVAPAAPAAFVAPETATGSAGPGSEGPAPAEAGDATGPFAAADPVPAAGGDTGEVVAGLPKRRRGQTLAAAQATPTTPVTPRASRPTSDPGARFQAFRDAGRGRTKDDASSPAPDDT